MFSPAACEPGTVCCGPLMRRPRRTRPRWRRNSAGWSTRRGSAGTWANALDEVARRTDNEDFAWIARAIEIHREVGGDLAEVLDHVGETIRDRNQIRGQVKALSAEGRMSALVLMALPIVMFVGLTLFNPLYSRVFTSTLPGFLMIAGRRRPARRRRLLAQPAHQAEVLGKQGENHANYCLRRHPGGHRPAFRHDLACLDRRPGRTCGTSSPIWDTVPRLESPRYPANEQLAALTRKAMPEGLRGVAGQAARGRGPAQGVAVGPRHHGEAAAGPGRRRPRHSGSTRRIRRP